jgi:PAS domain S-box-containing protein
MLPVSVCAQSCDPALQPILSFFGTLKIPFGIATPEGGLIHSNPALNALLEACGWKQYPENLTRWIEPDGTEAAPLPFTQNTFFQDAYPFEADCLLHHGPAPCGPAARPDTAQNAHLRRAHLRLEAYGGGGGSTPPHILMMLQPLDARHEHTTHSRQAVLAANAGQNLFGLWRSRIEEIMDSFELDRIAEKTCRILTDLTCARAVAFYSLHDTARQNGTGAANAWKRLHVLSSGLEVRVPDTLDGRVPWLQWAQEQGIAEFSAIQKHSAKDLPEWIRTTPDGALLTCQLRGDTLAIAFVWGAQVMLEAPEMRGLLEQITLQAAQAVEHSRWFLMARHSGTQSHEIIENANVIILGMDLQGKITLWNHKASDVFGYAGEDVLGRPIREILNLGNTTSNRVEHERFEKAIANQEPLTGFEWSVRDKQGRDRYVVWNTCLLSSADNHILGFYAIGQDITDLKELESQMYQTQRLESVGRLARGVAHDFNNILNGVGGFLYLMEKSPHDADAIRLNCVRIRELTMRASRLVRQMQTYARQGKTEKRTLDLNEALHQSLDIFRASLRNDSIRVETSLSCELPWIEGDFSQIEQVLMNLFMNAVEAMPAGGVLSVVTRSETIEDLQYACLEVRDSGCGMPASVKDRIFDPFYTTKKTGNGLGLSAVYGVLKAHGALLRVDSEVGIGTCFTIHFPVSQKKKEEILGQEKQRSLLVRGGNETILVVDDEEAIRLVTEDLLKTLGYRVILASDGDEAVEIYRERPQSFDLVLMDIDMPNLNGRAAGKIMRLARPDQKVLFTSGYTDDAQVESLRNAGFHHLLAKPYTMFDLQESVRTLLDTAQTPVG